MSDRGKSCTVLNFNSGPVSRKKTALSFGEEKRRKRGGKPLFPPSPLVPLLYLVEGEKLLFYLLSLRVSALPTKPKLHHLEAGQRGLGRTRWLRGDGEEKHGDNNPGVLGGRRGGAAQSDDAKLANRLAHAG